MGKRAINQAGVKSAKKVKADPVLASIADSIMQAEDLPERCRTMLVDSLPLSLGVPSDKRHEVQAAVVDMAKQVLDSKKSAMEAVVAAEDQQIGGLQASRADLMKAVEVAEVVLATQKEAVHGTRTLLADATVAVKASTQSLDDRRAEHKASTEKLAAAQAEKLALESAFDAHFKPMKEGAAAESHFKELEPHLKHVELESSLLIAVPSSCAKPVEERGSFDTVVLEELEKALSSKIAALGNTVAAETPVSGALETAMLAAQEEHVAKKDTQKRAVVDFEAARKEEFDRQAALNKAKETADELQPGIDAATERLENAKLALEAFESGPLAQFVTYSTLTSTASEEPTVEIVLEAAPLGA